jgi:hypothetical protein
LITINNETKVRRSTKLLVLGKAKVMSYKDLKEVRAKYTKKKTTKKTKSKDKYNRKNKSTILEADKTKADKIKADKTTTDKAKHGRKRKSIILETETPEPNIKVAWISKTLAPEIARASVIQISRTPVAENKIIPEP